MVYEQDRIDIEFACRENKERFILKKVIVFGCTPYLKCIHNSLASIGVKIYGIIDNDPNKIGNGRKCMGIFVYSPHDICWDNGYIFIVCSKYQYEMVAQLKSMGIDENNIVIIPVVETKPLFLNREQIYCAWEQTCKGKEIVETILENRENKFFFILPYKGTGDAYMACRYLPKYLEEHGIQEFVFIVNGENSGKVVNLFGYEYLQYSEKELQLILKAWEFWDEYKKTMKPLLHWGWRTKKYINNNKHKEITFKDMYLYDVYEYDKQYEGILPKQISTGSWRAFFIKYGLHEKRTVIISPYAGSFVSNIERNVWETIVLELKERGFCVITNCAGKEQPIDGTVPVCFPYDEAIGYVETAGFFIGVRSGLCDIISSANARLMILYESGFAATDYDFFGLNPMGIGNDCTEVIIDKVDDLVKDIIKFVERKR